MNYINLYIFIVSYFLILLVSKLILLDIALIHTLLNIILISVFRSTYTIKTSSNTVKKIILTKN